MMGYFGGGAVPPESDTPLTPSATTLVLTLPAHFEASINAIIGVQAPSASATPLSRPGLIQPLPTAPVEQQGPEAAPPHFWCTGPP